MIRLTRLNGSEVWVNGDLVSTVESHPDTVVTLVDGKRFVVSESGADVVLAFLRYRANVVALAASPDLDPVVPPEAPRLVMLATDDGDA